MPQCPYIIASAPSSLGERIQQQCQRPLSERDPFCWQHMTISNPIIVALREIDPTWCNIFRSPLLRPLLAKINQNLLTQRSLYLPLNHTLILNAFKLCPYSPKVIIVGQDPYAMQKNQANGLAFSVPRGVTIPPSLRNIYKELEDDIPTFTAPDSGDLAPWATQGVLLLNLALTVQWQHPGSQTWMWSDFISELIKLITTRSPTPIVFMLWGKQAQSLESSIRQPSRHLILTASHPSPLSAHHGWFGSHHFSQANQFLKSHGMEPIDWRLPA